jgi:hypothetical protein
MKYVLLICDDESDLVSFEEIDADPGHQEHLRLRGEGLFGARLRPTSEATTVRVRDGELLISDGPFAETKDFVGGVSAVECDNLDDAIAIAAAHPYAKRGAVEIRPIWEP